MGWGWKYNVGEDFLRNEERVVMRYNSVLDLHNTYFGEWTCILFT